MLCQLCRPSAGLKHNLALEDEHRSFFIVSSFGLLKGGSVTVNVSAFETRHKLDRIGFSLHRSPEESTEYDLNQVEGSDCIFEEAALADLDTMRIEMCSDTGKFTVVRDKLLGVAVDLSFQESGAGRVDTAVISLDTPDAADIYTLAFHVCSKEVPWVDLEIDIIEVNPGPEYLGAGKAPLPTLYGVMAGFFFVAAIAWGATLLKNRESKYFFKLHFLMMALVVVKALSLCFRAVDYHFISTLGTREEGWAILFYIVRFAKGLLLFFTVILVGAGYGFIKHVLSDREKKLFLVVIPLQLFANIAAVVIAETSEGALERNTWRSLALLVDLLCCGAVLFPIVWSIKHLREASLIDGKAAVNLKKLKLFRRFYVMVLLYIYTTRIIVYMIESTIPFRREWLSELVDEVFTLGFYVTAGIMFSPLPDNEYLHVPTGAEAEEIAMDEIVVSSTASASGLRNVKNPSKAET